MQNLLKIKKNPVKNLFFTRGIKESKTQFRLLQPQIYSTNTLQYSPINNFTTMKDYHLTLSEKNQLKQQAEEKGLYDPSYEKDACGFGFLANIKGKQSHKIIEQALEVLTNLTHRAAVGSDGKTGDGAGIMIQIPHDFFVEELKKNGVNLGDPFTYGVGMLFMPQDEILRLQCQTLVDELCEEEGLEVVAWRNVPVDTSVCGEAAEESRPFISQVFVKQIGKIKKKKFDEDEFVRKLYIVRRQIEKQYSKYYSDSKFNIVSFHNRTIVFKGLLMPVDLPKFYLDLQNPEMKSALAIIHSRFSTNTFPSWERAHPNRYLAHNGEINTIKGNIKWMRSRESLFESHDFTKDELQKLNPIVQQNLSDSGMLDNSLELLLHTGRSLQESMSILVPEAWQSHKQFDQKLKDYYEYQSQLVEPWDGPAAIAFTNGKVIGAMLDRNGLRPSRYIRTKDDLVVVASEVGCLQDLPEKDIVSKRRLRSGNMILIDTEKGELTLNDDIKKNLADQNPYGEWLKSITNLKDTYQPEYESLLPQQFSTQQLRQSQFMFGYVREDIRTVIRPMGQKGQEAIGSMGNDTPLAVLSQRPQLMYRYFKQSFAQVTNPPIDPIRENLVMSLKTYIGRQQNLFETGPIHCQKLLLEKPIITNMELVQLQHLKDPQLQSITIDFTIPIKKPKKNLKITGQMLEEAIEQLCISAENAVDAGYSIIILSDRNHSVNNVPIPMLLACSSVHNHLNNLKKRSLCSIILESGEPRDTQHMACLLGYGASAINPYMISEIFKEQEELNLLDGTTALQAEQNFIKACCKGIEKIMSKVGISTLHSYLGSQIFEAVGLNQTFIDKYFTRTTSKISGIGIEKIAEDVNARFQTAYMQKPTSKKNQEQNLDNSGDLAWRKGGEYHQYNPNTLFKIQESARLNSYKIFKEFSQISNESNKQLCTIRGLFDFKKVTSKYAIPIEEVESVEEIVKRFRTGAMSFGSISKEAHETLAQAMNTIGGKSNSGEGGELSERFGSSKNSGIKQVASGRFGVTSNYLVNCDEIQIKMAQGAKPGEGGHLPGDKVDESIAKTRYSTPGIDLISPPPHHDIYSIEDLSQLIYDLKNANDKATISVKLVSEAGVGTVTAGVAKAKANHIVIAGDQGGTGASPITSITNAGTPWEIGLAEAHQTLLVNGLRNNVKLETDGGLKTGRDVVIAALLGADQFGFGTISLIVTGCIMMRQCHLNTCPVGVATQNPELRQKYKGKPEHVINYMYFVAEEVREIMASLGIRKFDQMIGRVDLLETNQAIQHYKKINELDLSPILQKLSLPNKDMKLHFIENEPNHLEEVLDEKIIKDCQTAIENQNEVSLTYNITNTDRTVCTRLSSEISRKYGEEGLPQNTINLTFNGTAGQSFGAFMTNGINCTVYGDVNDYVGKGLCGGNIVVRPALDSTLESYNNTIAGNVVLFGATSGKVFINGRAGERFAVRNSGATAVVECVGDHACEYMTGGKVVILGKTGRNFAAGMSGGVAYIYDKNEEFLYNGLCNTSEVQIETPENEDLLFLKTLITEYHEKTDSKNAKEILKNWSKTSKNFIRVISPEYKKALQLQAKKKKIPKKQKDNLQTISIYDTLNRSVQERIKDFKEVEQELGMERSQIQADRCMDCGVPFCHKGCPLGNNIPDFNNFVHEGRWERAYQTLVKTNNFPEMTGRICPAPCEDICTRNIDGSPVNIRVIERQISSQSKAEGVLLKPIIAKKKTNKSVAIIGSGPAGLACAQQLARMGHSVTVYERDDRIGGLLRYGIPSFKMEKYIIDNRIKQMKKEGVTFKTNINVGVDISSSYLIKQYDSVVLATGAQQPREVPMDGRQLNGVHQAMEYLVQQNKLTEGDKLENYIDAKGKDVIVIGGGDTGSDCIGTAIRQGANSVTQIAYTPRPPSLQELEDSDIWFKQQAMTLKTSTSHQEGAQRDWSVLTKSFESDGEGNVKGLNLIRLDPINKKIDGKRVISEIPGSNFSMDSQLILLAVGFTGPEVHHPLYDSLGLKMNGSVSVNRKYMTNVDGVFACGDVKRGPSLLVWAIREGRDAATRVNKFIQHKSLKDMNVEVLDSILNQQTSSQSQQQTQI